MLQQCYLFKTHRQKNKKGIHESGINCASCRILSDYFLYYHNAALLFLMLRKILSEEMTHKPNNCDAEWNGACCPDRGLIPGHGTQGKDIFITSTGEIREKNHEGHSIWYGLSAPRRTRSKISRQRGKLRWKEIEIKAWRWKGIMFGERLAIPFGKGRKTEQRSGYTEEVLNGRPLGHIGLVFYPVNTVITHL